MAGGNSKKADRGDRHGGDGHVSAPGCDGADDGDVVAAFFFSSLDDGCVYKPWSETIKVEKSRYGSRGNNCLRIGAPCGTAGESQIRYVREHSMTSPELVNQLTGMERVLFRFLFAGGTAKKLYRMYEYEW